ncbi:host attachment protein [Palleronia sp. KMU-117]|uniref:host attachment protein n=1 Tax=Palleronia sp. KMU-117 TaxID=3434108 RepID=UPI003D73727A
MDKKHTWALVMNATVARILRGFADGDFVPPPELVLKTEHRNLKEIMADKRGRSFQSTADGRRSAMEYASDPLHDDVVAFARKAVELLNSHVLAGDFTALAIIADPKVLGILREELPERLRKRSILEVPKNLLHLSEADLSDAVEAELRAVGT